MYRSEYFASRAEANAFIISLIREAVSYVVYFPVSGVIEVRFHWR